MKKKAFTLAEILLTLGIIGIVAAATLPLLNNSVKNVQASTKLAKAVSEFEQANLALLDEEGVDSILDAFDGIDTHEYHNALSRHMKIRTANNSGIFIPIANAENMTKLNAVDMTKLKENELSKEHKFKNANEDNTEVVSDGILKPVNDEILKEALDDYKRGKHFSTESGIDYCILRADPAGLNKPLPPSQQRIGFLVVDIDGPDNGSNKVGIDRFGFALYNDGSLRAIGSQNWDNAGKQSKSWKAKCPNNSKIPDSELDALYCTGSIFENDMKIKYSAR